MNEQPPQFHRFALVSSLYGPGSVTCWFLTNVSCAISWSIHPKKRKDGSVDSDFIAAMTYSVVSAAHLIAQVHQFVRENATKLTEKETKIAQRMAAIEAALNITETSMAFCVILFLICTAFKCLKRGIIVALAGLFCLSAEVYLHWNTRAVGAWKGNFTRLYLTDFGSLLLAVSIIIGFSSAASSGLLFLFFKHRPRIVPQQIPLDIPEANDYTTRRQSEVDKNKEESRPLFLITQLSLIILPVSFLASMFPFAVSLVKDLTFNTFSGRLTDLIIPRSSISIYELDQALALLAGMTIVGFRLYGSANYRYLKWKDQDIERNSRTELQNITTA